MCRARRGGGGAGPDRGVIAETGVALSPRPPVVAAVSEGIVLGPDPVTLVYRAE